MSTKQQDLKAARIKANNELVQRLYELITKYPNLRFGQILSGFGFVESKPTFTVQGMVWTDEFYTEPHVILERVEKAIKEINQNESSSKIP